MKTPLNARFRTPIIRENGLGSKRVQNRMPRRLRLLPAIDGESWKASLALTLPPGREMEPWVAA